MSKPQETLLIGMLQVAVPLWMDRIRGLSWDERKRAAEKAAVVLRETLEAILYPMKKKGESARAFNACAEAIAVLSYTPGGVKVFGCHWQGVEEECFATEEEALDFMQYKKEACLFRRGNTFVVGW